MSVSSSGKAYTVFTADMGLDPNQERPVRAIAGAGGDARLLVPDDRGFLTWVHAHSCQDAAYVRHLHSLGSSQRASA